MPTRVQKRPAEISRMPSEKYAEHDPSHINRDMQHKEALSLRLALGSILAPKRPFTPSSHSSSGTASPAHPASFGSTSSPGPPPPPNPTPIHVPDGRFDGYLHPKNVHLPHTPSRLGQTELKELQWPFSSPLPSAPSSAPMSPQTTPGVSLSPTDEHPPPLVLPSPVVESPMRPQFPCPKPASAPHLGQVPAAPGVTGSRSGTPKAKFLETLDSKSAWDALIHGSFS